MILSITGGRKHFWQWDLNQRLYITGEGQPCQVHFVQEGSDQVLEVETVKEDDGRLSVLVPNILLQEAKPFEVYIYTKTVDGPCRTEKKAKYIVMERVKPEGYIYEETEVKTWEGLAKRCEDAVTAAEKAQAEAEQAANEAKEARDEVVAVIGDIDAALDAIIDLQDAYIAGGAAE